MLLDSRVIINLQEVDVTLYSELSKLFITKGYFHQYSSYDTKRSGYMGVLTAWPQEYPLVKLERIRISDIIPEYCTKPSSNKSYIQYIKYFITWIIHPFQSYHLYKHPEPDPWKIATYRKNVLLSTALEINQQKVVIHNYHMPCAYWCPKVIDYHLETILQYINTDKSTKYNILVGDFNAKLSDMNKLLTDNNFTNLSHSAEYTTKVVTKKGPFDGILDYIFLTKEFSNNETYVYRLDETKNAKDLTLSNDSILPDQYHASDHAIIYSKFTF